MKNSIVKILLVVILGFVGLLLILVLDLKGEELEIALMAISISLPLVYALMSLLEVVYSDKEVNKFIEKETKCY